HLTTKKQETPSTEHLPPRKSTLHTIICLSLSKAHEAFAPCLHAAILFTVCAQRHLLYAEG
ncbi:MAG TPA: hypothetical protein DCE42_12585, partial [Myxococcales bacterium]|nr:hypothetical protein [Myxococcales bacterium]